MRKPVFRAADLLIPDLEHLERWAVIACDQFSSNPEYWKDVESLVGNSPSAFHLILPEAWLESEKGRDHQSGIQKRMREYLDNGLFKKYPDSMIFVERELQDGSVRKGLVGLIDLEDYDFDPKSSAAIKATEETILERIPPRQAIRSQALVELPHVLLLADDTQDDLLSFSEDNPVLYDFDLMLQGGHIKGSLIEKEELEDFYKRLMDYSSRDDALLFVVGDGNHSLAAAKSYWNSIKSTVPENHPARFALVELENIHDPSLKFEPIHRLLTGINPAHLLETIEDEDGDTTLEVFVNGNKGELKIKSDSPLILSTLQKRLDAYLKENPGSIDYIHGEKELEALSAKEDRLGILLPAIDKGDLFQAVIKDGVLPRKTFSMGHAREKRYYLEARELNAAE